MMTLSRVTLAVSAVLALGLTAAAPPPGVDELRGTWALTGGEVNGKPLPPKLLAKRFRLVIGDGKWDSYTGSDPKPEHLTFTLDPSASPKRVDLIDPTDAHPADEGELGIYKVEGDTLTINLNRPGGKERPTDFHATDHSAMVRVYTRVKT